jgi:hypothetical protein
MFKRNVMALAVAVALGLPGVATAQSQDELGTLREEIRQLGKRVDEAEQAVIQASNRPSTENALNPAASLILNGIYSNLSRDPAGFGIDGFVPAGGEVGPRVRGLSLGESELALSSNIDHNFRGTGIFSLTPEDTVAIEEAYIQTLSLSHGFTAKAGRFFSGLGYQNQVHAHAWDFTDAPLASKVFLGSQRSDDGIQLKWVAPTPTYFDIGVEAGRGAGFPSGPEGGRNKNGFGSGVVFGHVGGDFGTGAAWQLGLSHLTTSPQDRTYDDVDSAGTPVTNSFSGKSRLWVVDGILKWAPNYNPTSTYFKLQGEFFRRRENGGLIFDTAGDTAAGTQAGGYTSTQSGWYLQGVYQFVPMWRVGYRYDRVSAGTASNGLVDSGALTAADFPILAAHTPTRHTVMIDWSPSEFSRVRLQGAHDNSRADVTDNQVFLQYIVSLGAHGAHKF